jgi:hypothetical protein
MNTTIITNMATPIHLTFFIFVGLSY